MKSKSELKKVFVCSPFRGLENTEGTAGMKYQYNLRMTKAICRYIMEKGAVPCCPHLYFPKFLFNSDQNEGELGMPMGQIWLAQCDEMWVIGRRISEGMEREIVKAKEWEIPIKHYVMRRSPEERLLDAILYPDTEYYEFV